MPSPSIEKRAQDLADLNCPIPHPDDIGCDDSDTYADRNTGYATELSAYQITKSFDE